VHKAIFSAPIGEHMRILLRSLALGSHKKGKKEGTKRCEPSGGGNTNQKFLEKGGTSKSPPRNEIGSKKKDRLKNNVEILVFIKGAEGQSFQSVKKFRGGVGS